MDKVNISSFQLSKKAIKEQGYVQGEINGIKTAMLIDTGAEISLISSKLFNLFREQSVLIANDVDLYTANGTAMNVLGKTAIELRLNDRTFIHDVVVVEHCSYNFLLGRDFLIRNEACIDFASCSLKLSDMEIGFVAPKERKIVSTVSDLNVAAKTTVAIQTQLDLEHPLTTDILIEGGFSKDNSYFVARILTKAQSKNKNITVQISNLTEKNLFLPKNTEVADAIFFVEEKDANLGNIDTLIDEGSFFSEGDLNIGHLEPEQRKQLVEVLKEMNISKSSELGRVKLVQHKIDVGGAKPIRQPSYRVPIAKKDVIDTEVEKMLVKEIIRPSTSPWSSPIVLVSKPDGSTRFCIDYRKVNSVTKKDAYPLPRIDDTLNALGGAKYFTTLDLQSGYWQVGLEEKSKEVTAFTTSKGHWEFNVLPFGLTNAPATFQRLMDLVLTGLHWSECLVYLDDIIIFGRTFDEHLSRLRTVLERLNQAGLTLKPSKCQWARNEVIYLGHLIDGTGIRPDPAKCKAVKDFPIPKSKTDVRAFLGLASYYRRFIKDFAEIAKPLTELTKTKNNCKFEWCEKTQNAFELLKSRLLNPPILRCPDFKCPFILQTDASNYGLGVVLAQERDGEEIVIAYASRQLKESERKYATIQKECLAIVWGIKYFHYFLFGQPHFTIITDHCPLQWIKKMEPKSQMIQRWICEIQGYSFSVQHRNGTANANADALSRCPITSELEEDETCMKSWDIGALELVDVTQLQDSDEEIKELKDYLSDGTLPECSASKNKIKKYAPQYLLENDILYHKWSSKVLGNNVRLRKQLVVPACERGKLLHHSHDEMGHAGFLRTLSRLRENYFWITMKKDVARHVKNCRDCAKRKSPKICRPVPLHPIEVNEPLEMVGVDFVGPLPITENGNRYIMTFQDHFTRWPAAYALKEATDKEVVDCIRTFSHDFGYPATILSDRGSAFLSDLVKRACKVLNIKHNKTSSYHPQANGLCERFHSTLKTSLSLVIDNGKANWDVCLSDFVGAYRTTPHTVTKETPAFLMFGRQFNVSPKVEFQAPVKQYNEDFLSERINNLREAYQIVRKRNRKEKHRHKAEYDKKHHVEKCSFRKGDLVYLKAGEKKSGLDASHWLGPYEIVEVISEENVKLKMNDSKRHPVVNVNRLKVDKSDNLRELSKSVKRILDKMRTRTEKGRLETKFFVQLENGETLWISDDFIDPHLIMDFAKTS